MAAVAQQPAPRSLSKEDSSKAALEAQQYLQSRLTTTSESPSFRKIPVISLEKSFSPNPSDRQAVAAEINDACRNVGFFYITHHGIPQNICDSVLDLAKRFFDDLSEEGKERIHMKNSTQFRGYEPSAFTTVNSLDGGGKETKEAFNWGYEAGLDPSGGDGKYVELDGSKPDGRVNLWPDERELPGFYEGIKEYYGQVLQLSRHLFGLFALSLALPEDFFDPMMTHPGGIARLIRYPPSTDPKPLTETKQEEEIGLGAHSDYECFTLLLQSKTPGLEVLSPDGRWVSADPVQGGIVVNVADFLMRWTNGVYKSTIHRVVNRTDRERFSIPLFFSINYDETVETLPSCVSEESPSRFPPITAGRYVLDRLALTIKDGGY